MYSNLVMEDEKAGCIPEELIGNDVYVLRWKERDPGDSLQKLINDVMKQTGRFSNVSVSSNN